MVSHRYTCMQAQTEAWWPRMRKGTMWITKRAYNIPNIDKTVAEPAGI